MSFSSHFRLENLMDIALSLQKTVIPSVARNLLSRTMRFLATLEMTICETAAPGRQQRKPGFARGLHNLSVAVVPAKSLTPA
jgi:hypothetical protein